MTDNQWRTYSPDNPPGDDDWPTEYRLILLRLNNTISESGAVCIGYVKQGSQGPYFVHIGVEGEVTHYKDSLGDDFSVPGWALINTPPEPELPKLYMGGEEIKIKLRGSRWRATWAGATFLSIRIGPWETKALAHAAVVELLQSFRVDGYLPYHQVPGPVTGDDLLPPCRVCGEPAQFLPELERMQCWKCKVIFAGPDREAKWRKLMGPDSCHGCEDDGATISSLREQLAEQGKELASAERVMDAYHDHRVKYPKEGE